MNFHFEDLENNLKSTRFGTIRPCVDQSPSSEASDHNATPLTHGNHILKPYDESINVDSDVSFGRNVTRHIQRKRRPKTSQGTEDNETEHEEMLKKTNDGDTSNVVKKREETKQIGDVIDDLEDDSLNINGYSICVVNKSWLTKQDVARGWSESLREIFLTSPEKSSNDSTAASLVDLSEIETSLETRNSNADSSWSEYIDGKTGNDTSYSLSVDTQAVSESDVSEFSPTSADLMSDLKLSRTECTSETSNSSASLDSPIHLNDNESWSIYSTSGCETNTSSASAEVDYDEPTGEVACDGHEPQPDSALLNVEAQTEKVNTDSCSKRVSIDSIILKAYSESTGLNPSDTADNCQETQSESSAAFNEFQHDFDFLATCTNKMSTPEKNTSARSMEESQEGQDSEGPYLDETADTSSSIEPNETESDSSCTEPSSYISTTATSASSVESSYLRHCQSLSSQLLSPPPSSSKFVHGLSPLCTTNASKSASLSKSTKFVRRRIIVLNKSLQDSKTKLAFNRKLSMSPTRADAILRRSAPNVRRRIIFTNNKSQHEDANNLHVDRASFSDSIRNMIANDSKEAASSVFTEPNVGAKDMKRTDDTHSSQHNVILPKCMFKDETEEAVYYLITKYLDNKECPW